jgi:hypothetical protein
MSKEKVTKGTLISWNGCTRMEENNPVGLQGTFVEYVWRGYEPPCEGTKALVEAYVSLPMSSAVKDSIREDYVYGPDVTFFGAPLVPSWGISKIQGFRTATIGIKADTIAEGFEAARTEVETELKKLSALVKTRNAELEKINSL